MITDMLIIIVGIALVLWGANRLTDGAVAIAGRMGIPQIVIGLTIVAMGTSMPEFCVSLVSALKGTPDLAVGNIVGSNIFNTLCIVGLAALVAPMTILPSTVKKDVPFALGASVLLAVMCLYDGNLSRIDALVLLLLFIIFMAVTLRGAQSSATKENGEPASAGVQEKPISYLKATLLIVIGLACLIAGSNLFVDAATDVARKLGVSEAVIGLTIVACGTSLPELATSIVAARKGNSGIAIGNVLGSNVFNILMILGVTGLICPMTPGGITAIDYTVLVGSMAILWLFSYTKLKIQRWEGAVLALVYLGYMVYLISMAV